MSTNRSHGPLSVNGRRGIHGSKAPLELRELLGKKPRPLRRGTSTCLLAEQGKHGTGPNVPGVRAWRRSALAAKPNLSKILGNHLARLGGSNPPPPAWHHRRHPRHPLSLSLSPRFSLAIPRASFPLLSSFSSLFLRPSHQPLLLLLSLLGVWFSWNCSN